MSHEPNYDSIQGNLNINTRLVCVFLEEHVQVFEYVERQIT